MMHFTSGINRPPYESESEFLQVTSGCSHATCTFCAYFKDTRFIISPMEEIEEDIKELASYGHKPKRIFLQGADAFAADFNTLMKMAELIHQYIPSVETIGGYARIDNFTDKSIEELKAMKKAGFSNPYIGIESGDDNILKMVNKGYDSALAREQLLKLDAADFVYTVNFLNGLGGAGYGLEHARKTAKLYEGLNPERIDIASLTLVPGTILDRRKKAGKFEEATEVERLIEIQEFLRVLKNNIIFQAEHVSVPFYVKTKIPQNSKLLISQLQEMIDRFGDEKLQKYRENLRII